jgi:putative transposase
MQRLLNASGASGERRAQREPVHHAVPRLRARAPNEVWTWDITKLATHQRGVYLSLYVILDLFSRYVVAWMVSRRENSALARQLLREAIDRYRIAEGTLTVHQDRGAPMTAHAYLNMLDELNVTPSHSRPRVSNDNPFSESHFKTGKYQPDYPGKFVDQEHGRLWWQDFFGWYNFEHHHSALALFTPAQVFTGEYRAIGARRQEGLDQAYAESPQRFVNGKPHVAMPPTVVEINPVTDDDDTVSTQVNFPTHPIAVALSRGRPDKKP